MDTIGVSRDIVYEDIDQFQQIDQKVETIVEQVDEQNETIGKRDKNRVTIQDQEINEQDRIEEMKKMLSRIEEKYEQLQNDYIYDKNTAQIDVSINKSIINIQDISNELETLVNQSITFIQSADISEDFQIAKDHLLLNLISQSQKNDTEQQTKQNNLTQQYQEENRIKDNKIIELENQIRILEEQNKQYVKEVDQLRFQPQSLNHSKIIEQNNLSHYNNNTPQKIYDKLQTEGNNTRDLWLPQNELQSNDFTYYSKNSTTSKNKMKLKPIHGSSSIPHFEYIPPPKTNILQTSLNKELQKVVKANRNIFLQAIKEDVMQRQNTASSKRNTPSYQQFHTPQTDTQIANQYRIKKLSQNHVDNRNIFTNSLSTESLLFPKNIIHHNQQINNNHIPIKKTSLTHLRDMNDFFFEKPASANSKNH